MVSHFYQKQSHQLDVSVFSKIGALPAFIPLYIGMPVILRGCNISTDLKITNGSKGIVRHIAKKYCSSEFSHAKAALIEFTDSLVKCKDIPTGRFLIEPISWTFVTTLHNPDGTKTRTKITHHQLPIEPAFSSTSHGCQGQTISKILADLWIRGSSTYVQASRVTKREGICSMESIIFADLNKPLPIHLKKENMRLHALEKIL